MPRGRDRGQLFAVRHRPTRSLSCRRDTGDHRIGSARAIRRSGTVAWSPPPISRFGAQQVGGASSIERAPLARRIHVENMHLQPSLSFRRRSGYDGNSRWHHRFLVGLDNPGTAEGVDQPPRKRVRLVLALSRASRAVIGYSRCARRPADGKNVSPGTSRGSMVCALSLREARDHRSGIATDARPSRGRARAAPLLRCVRGVWPEEARHENAIGSFLTIKRWQCALCSDPIDSRADLVVVRRYLPAPRRG